MSDKPRDQQPDGYETADEPTTGPPAGAVSASSFDLGATPGRSDPGTGADPDAVPGFRTSPSAGGPAGSSTRPDSGTTYGATATPGTSDDAPGARDATRAGSTPTSGTTAAPGASTTSSSGTTSGGGATPGAGARDAAGAKLRSGPAAGTKTAGARLAPDAEARTRRKRRLIVAGIAVAAALVVIALCAGGLAVLRAVSGFQDDAAEAREDRRLRDGACLELEGRLNRLVPPGATTTPQARAVAVRNENAATRIYVARLDDQRVSDGWRELLDARTAFAEALDAQVRSRTPAFFVAPAPRDGISLADQLTRWSPGACAGPVRRLSAPDL
jgi:hypothetical protein